MRCVSWLAIWFLGLALSAGSVTAEVEDALRTTTEFGITLTPEDITEAIAETQQFWEPVHQYIGSDAFAVGDASARAAAAHFFSGVQEGLYKQLFESDEAAAQDLIDYLGLRVRKYLIYAELRTALADDVRFAALVERWEKAHRDVNALPSAERPRHAARLTEVIDREMAAAGLSEARCVSTRPIWQTHAECMARMYATRTGALMIEFEHRARAMPTSAGEFLRQVMAAADWAMIVKPAGSTIGLPEFKAAWKQLEELKDQRVARRPSAAQ